MSSLHFLHYEILVVLFYSLIVVLVILPNTGQFRMSRGLLVAILFISSLVISTRVKSPDERYCERVLTGIPKTKVVILNDLPDKGEVQVHCQSKDDDLEVHVFWFHVIKMI